MSLWACVEHGLTGPSACCGKASLASLTEQRPPMKCERGHALYGVQEVRCQLCDVARIEALEAALREIASDARYLMYNTGDCTFEALGKNREIARTALAALERETNQ